MSESLAATLETFWRAWAKRDKAAALLLMSSDIRFAMHIPQETVPFGGETIGLPAFSDRLQTILDAFDTLHFQGTVTGVTGHVVRGQVSYAFRHKWTGEILEGVMRHVASGGPSRIAVLEEYHDVERIKAFMRLVSHSAAR